MGGLFFAWTFLTFHWRHLRFS